MDQIGFAPHDHAACISGALDAAVAVCARDKLQLTPVRRRVLEILLRAHKAQGAYDILARLSAEGLGSQPPAVYRALDFLTTHGLAHRVEKLNAFVACTRPGPDHLPAFLICRSCQSVAEDPMTKGTCPPGLSQSMRETGFQLEDVVLEAVGLCPECQTGTPPA